jgi:hypothetical protein
MDNDFEQELITKTGSGSLVIYNLFAKDYPINPRFGLGEVGLRVSSHPFSRKSDLTQSCQVVV